MFIGKARFIQYKDFTGGFFGGKVYFTRKDRKHIIEGHSCNPGKRNKQEYNRAIRNGKHKLRELKNNQWKRLHCADLWKWC